MRRRSSVRFLLLYAMGLAGGLASTGCSGACAEAKDLCEICELDGIKNCERFDDQDSESCEKAVSTYEASCAGAA